MKVFCFILVIVMCLFAVSGANIHDAFIAAVNGSELYLLPDSESALSSFQQFSGEVTYKVTNAIIGWYDAFVEYLSGPSQDNSEIMKSTTL